MAIQNKVADHFLPFGTLVADSASSFYSFSSSLIRRMGNTLAHALSHLLLENLDVLEALDLPAGLGY